MTTNPGVIWSVYSPGGLKIRANLGKAARASISESIHWHIVPRWSGYMSFISFLGRTRILHEDLETTYRRIRTTWNKIEEKPVKN